MANTVQIKRGNTASVSSYTGPSGEVIYNLETNRLHSQDGSVAGGHPHALMSDVNIKANASVNIEAGAGLTGGGTLAASRTLALSSASIASLALADTAVQSVNGKTGASVTLTKSDVGLSNVDNTSDANKPISTATQTALNAKANSSVTVSAGTGLTGGGNLTANRSIALNATSVASLGKADTALQAPGGTTGQILAKNSNDTNDVAWVSSEAATAVSYGPQTLTEEQKGQARDNIGAISIEDIHIQAGEYIFESLRARRKVVSTRGAGYKIREIGNIFELKTGGYGFVFSEHLEPYSENNVYVYLATSTDGVTWTRSNTPIVTRSSEDPYVAIINGNYHLYVEDKEEVPFRSIRLYTSPDLSSWTDAGNILNPTPVGNWESEDVSSPVVFFYDGKWNLYYEGRGSWPTAPYNSGAIGLATSTDGINWTRNPNNPVLRGYQDGVSNTWFSHVVPDDVFVLDDTVVLYAHPFVPRDRLTDSSTGGFFCSTWVTNDLVNISDALGKPAAIQVTPGNSERSVDTLMVNKFSDQVSFFAANYDDGVYEYVEDKSKCLLSAYASASTITSFAWQRLPITSLKYIVGIGTINNGGLNILAKTAGVYKLDVASQFPMENTSVTAASSRVQILRGDGTLSRSIVLTQGDTKGFIRRGVTEVIVLCPGDQLYFEIFSENIIGTGLEINMSINLERL